MFFRKIYVFALPLGKDCTTTKYALKNVERYDLQNMLVHISLLNYDPGVARPKISPPYLLPKKLL